MVNISIHDETWAYYLYVVTNKWNIYPKHQDCHCHKIHSNIFTENCDGFNIWGTERVLFTDCNLKCDKISLGYCTHLLIHLRDVTKWKSRENSMKKF